MNRGVPTPKRWNVTTTGGEYGFGGGDLSSYLQVAPHGTTVVRVYFTQAEFAADAAAAPATGAGDPFLELDAANGEMLDGPANMSRIWLRAVGVAGHVTIMPYHKRSPL